MADQENEHEGDGSQKVTVPAYLCECLIALDANGKCRTKVFGIVNEILNQYVISKALQNSGISEASQVTEAQETPDTIASDTLVEQALRQDGLTMLEGPRRSGYEILRSRIPCTIDRCLYDHANYPTPEVMQGQVVHFALFARQDGSRYKLPISPKYVETLRRIMARRNTG